MSLCCLGYSAGFLRQYVMIPLSEHHSAFCLTLRGQEIRFGSGKRLMHQRSMHLSPSASFFCLNDWFKRKCVFMFYGIENQACVFVVKRSANHRHMTSSTQSCRQLRSARRGSDGLNSTRPVTTAVLGPMSMVTSARGLPDQSLLLVFFFSFFFLFPPGCLL